MATKKIIKEILKEFNLTHEEMSKIWEELIESNWKCKSLHNAGKNWTDLNDYLIRQLPTQKQKDIESAERKRKEEEEKQAQEKKAKEEKEYYENHFEELMISKIDNKEKLTERELQRLVGEYDIETSYGDNRRWSRSASTVIELLGRFFIINWEDGLTENQINTYDNQPIEVKREEKKKTITVVEWVQI